MQKRSVHFFFKKRIFSEIFFFFRVTIFLLARHFVQLFYIKFNPSISIFKFIWQPHPPPKKNMMMQNFIFFKRYFGKAYLYFEGFSFLDITTVFRLVFHTFIDSCIYLVLKFSKIFFCRVLFNFQLLFNIHFLFIINKKVLIIL